MTRRGRSAPRSPAHAEPLPATASRVDHWILIEYRGLWAHDAVDGSASRQVKAHLARARRPPATPEVLFVRRTERRGRRRLLRLLGQLARARRELWLARARPPRGPARARPATAPGEPVDHPLLLVCTHGKHDRCCARYGRPLYDALARAGRGRLGLAVVAHRRRPLRRQRRRPAGRPLLRPRRAGGGLARARRAPRRPGPPAPLPRPLAATASPRRRPRSRCARRRGCRRSTT